MENYNLYIIKFRSIPQIQSSRWKNFSIESLIPTESFSSIISNGAQMENHSPLLLLQKFLLPLVRGDKIVRETKRSADFRSSSTPSRFEKAIHPRDNSLLFRFPAPRSPNAERIRVERRDLRKKKCGHGS